MIKVKIVNKHLIKEEKRIMENNIVKNVNIKKNQLNQYIKVPFNVPDNVEAINIVYSYDGDDERPIPKIHEKNVIDIAILNEKDEMVGSSSFVRSEIIISSVYSTYGYDEVTINAGDWTIILGANMIRGESVDVTIEINFLLKQARWLMGDLHMHSVNSDGKYFIEELADKALKCGLDFIAITDHNTFYHNKRLPVIEGLTIIPGVEYTHYQGHMNIWGVKLPYNNNFAVNSFEEFLEIHNTAKSKGALTSINHPFCSLTPWKWPMEGFDFNCVEVWAAPMRRDNLKNIEWWHNELIKGKKIVAVGGSDFHKNAFVFKLLAKPTTMVYCHSNTKQDILNAVRKGRVAIKKAPNAPLIELNCNQFIMGDTVKLQKDTKLKVKVDKLKKKHILTVLDKDGVLHEYQSNKTKSYEIELDIKKAGFVRAEIRYNAGLLESLIYRVIIFFTIKEQSREKVPQMISSMTNPIYFE